MDFILLIINSIFDLIILIAFFKMSANTTTIREILSQNTSNRRNARANYYTYLTLGNKKAAYEQLLYIIFHELTDFSLNKNDRELKYNELKERYSAFITKLGYEFPDFPF